MTKPIQQIMVENQVGDLGQLQELRTSRQVVDRLLASNLEMTEKNNLLEMLFQAILNTKTVDEAKAIARQALSLDRVGNTNHAA